ncbi:small acid-soluble spore protein P [Cohnella thailandensis]|jgi:Small acid-soluble spore protein P family.|uniref:Small acid-soluble spore protein P n=1 Tax=Cohnella thailandensis TaxID=557557 RepID=A0A841SUH2_9BACL|nr:small acid-soluble spore protein P [Cohnella thailandensis]MBB6633277.1 small acid-soluble spore protein P [Cohnella thailandensis]MBP1975025.1 small acid-soluble spore protein P (minor) [Cohnella thailandensis]
MKPRNYSISTGDPQSEHGHDKRQGRNRQPNEPLSGSKKVKTHNHVSHNNPEG